MLFQLMLLDQMLQVNKSNLAFPLAKSDAESPAIRSETSGNFCRIKGNAQMV